MSFFNAFGLGQQKAAAQVPPQVVNTPATGQVPATTQNGAPAASGGMQPFSYSAKKHIEVGPTYSGVAFGGKFAPNVPAYGYLDQIVLEVNASGGSGVATVAAAEDAPWSAVSQLLVSDPSGLQIANLSGYDWYLVQRYAAKALLAIESDTNSFSAIVTGANASGNFDIRLPLYLSYGQYGRGSLADSNQAATFKASVTFGNAAAVYTTAPTTPPTLSGQLESFHRMVPLPVDAFQRQQTTVPPVAGSYITYSTQSQAVTNGLNTLFIARVGNVIRAIFLIFRDASGSRAGAVSGGTFPTQFQMDWDTGVKYICTSKTWQQKIALKTGLVTPAAVLPILFLDNDSLGGVMLGDDGSEYLPTLGGTKVKFSWNSTVGGGSVEALVVDVVSRDGGIAVTAPQVAP